MRELGNALNRLLLHVLGICHVFLFHNYENTARGEGGEGGGGCGLMGIFGSISGLKSSPLNYLSLEPTAKFF